MTRYVINMAKSDMAAMTIVATETRNLCALPFLPTEDQLRTGKALEECSMILKESSDTSEYANKNQK